MASSKGLGRGLGALMGDAALQTQEAGSVFLPVSQVEPGLNQPRKRFDEESLADLADSIREHGVIQPLTVRRLSSGYYQIIAGERRWRASRMAGLHEIPAVVLDVDENTAYALALIENLQREDLNPMEEAEGYRRLTQELGLTQEQAARRVGISRPAVANALRLLSLPKAVAALLRDKEISAGHARALLPLEDPERMEQAAKTVIGQQLSVRQTELLVKRLLSQPKDAPEKQPDIYVADLERAMEALTGHRIAIQPGAKKGRVVIEYYGNEDLEAVCDALKSIKKQNN